MKDFLYRRLFLSIVICCFAPTILAQKTPKFKVIAFFTGKSDMAHISYVNEANHWLPEVAKKNNFVYDTTSNWTNMNAEFLAKYQVVLFLDTRPEDAKQRVAFENYMKNGGAWMGFHFSAFALTPSTFTQNWDWYHNEFLGSGQYSGNTWRPTSATLNVNRNHEATKNLPKSFKSQPNEWYKWENDLRKNPNITVLLSIDSSSFPLGTGPKPHEIWNNGDYPVVWSNKHYKMIYVNMGHNDMDYEHKYGKKTKALSYTFDNSIQNRMIIDGILWLGNSKKAKVKK
ncbi:ThuA domain-containing protein [Pedobacter sp. ASV28]|uniref:ThuA domain-containing protein n=1 Tax=Pedobacter sp. ASV28 TaxID=2795123 RepID=UPI0018EADC46|nr:ThuA domain-containing protein [Pedobacter sp. ASV28]